MYWNEQTTVSISVSCFYHLGVYFAFLTVFIYLLLVVDLSFSVCCVMWYCNFILFSYLFTMHLLFIVIVATIFWKLMGLWIKTKESLYHDIIMDSVSEIIAIPKDHNVFIWLVIGKSTVKNSTAHPGFWQPGICDWNNTAITFSINYPWEKEMV